MLQPYFNIKDITLAERIDRIGMDIEVALVCTRLESSNRFLGLDNKVY